ncbi:MAG TPA: M20/M25/M40 family metallo-hydrolase [Gemmatimonadaceae bacterium]|nr:M20/M25/M40 family metallo-hydrolase [Gemmatimonadaceae bacterium]
MKQEDAVALTRALVQIDSRNPTLSADGPGERNVALALGRVLENWGFSVEVGESDRPNLVARIGPSGSPAMMFAGHLDTVGVEGMTHDPFSGDMTDGRLYGRGSCDMKSGVAAMCVAALTASQQAGASAARQIMITAVSDEEYESLGMRAMLDSGIRAEHAILTEPTRLAICPAHRGFVWSEIEFTGRAAHGSRWDIGIDAIRHAGLVLAAVDELDAGALQNRTHPLLGRGSIHASTIVGGIGMSTYPDKCILRIERRTIPGESAEDSIAELQSICEQVRARRPELDTTVRLIAAQEPSDVGIDAPVVRALVKALDEENLSAPVEGLSAWTDAALLNAAGIPAVCFGPGDIALAHAAEEFVPIDEIEKATRVLTRVALDWMLEKD